MAHKTEVTCLRDLQKQIVTNYTNIIVWKKDWERWSPAIIKAMPEKWLHVTEDYTKNQIIVGKQIK